MAYVIEDRVMETSTTTGTGALTLAGAVTGYKAFSSVCTVGDTFYYSIEAIDGSGVATGEWETGIGTYSGTNTLTRTTVHNSSNSDAAVTLSAGTKRVMLSATAALLNRPYRGALVTKAADQTGANYTTSTAIAWDSETRDTDGFHDNAISNTRLTVPTGVNRVRVSGHVRIASHTADTWVYISIRKNAAFLYTGGAEESTEIGATDANMTIDTAVLDVVAGDYFELFLGTESDTTIDVTAQRSWFSIEVVEQTQAITQYRPYKGALVKKSADQTAANYTALTAMAFNSETYDTDSFHDNATNNTRLTVPLGVTKVRLSGQVRIANGTIGDWAYLAVQKNGSLVWDGVPSSFIGDLTGGTHALTITSSVVDVVAGDYFELYFQVESDNSIDITATRSWFSIEVVETYFEVRRVAHRGALVAFASDGASTNYTTAAALPFGASTEAYDTDNIHDEVTNNTRLTVPSGVTKVRLTGQILHSTTGTSGSFNSLSVTKNGTAAYPGAPWQYVEITASTGRVNISSPILAVTGGDYFELLYQSETDTTIVLLASYTWFSMEIIC